MTQFHETGEISIGLNLGLENTVFLLRIGKNTPAAPLLESVMYPFNDVHNRRVLLFRFGHVKKF